MSSLQLHTMFERGDASKHRIKLDSAGMHGHLVPNQPPSPTQAEPRPNLHE